MSVWISVFSKEKVCHENWCPYARRIRYKNREKMSEERAVPPIVGRTSRTSWCGYAEKHDEAIKVIEDDYRKLPRRTRRGKRYYENARRRANQMHERRLDELFAQIACQPAVG